MASVDGEPKVLYSRQPAKPSGCGVSGTMVGAGVRKSRVGSGVGNGVSVGLGGSVGNGVGLVGNGVGVSAGVGVSSAAPESERGAGCWMAAGVGASSGATGPQALAAISSSAKATHVAAIGRRSSIVIAFPVNRIRVCPGYNGRVAVEIQSGAGG